MEITFDWVNGGEPFELPGMPVAGTKAVNEIKRRNAKAMEDYFRVKALSNQALLVQVKRILDKHGVEKAYPLWINLGESRLGEDRREEWDWPKEDFEDKLNAYVDEILFKQYETKDLDEVNEKLDAELKTIDVDKMAQTIDSAFLDIHIVELYWRLRRKFKTIEVDGEQVPLSPSALEQVVVYPDDVLKMRGIETKNESPVSEEFDVPGEGDIKKKSSKSESSLTDSSPTSEPSSEDSTEGEKK